MMAAHTPAAHDRLKRSTDTWVALDLVGVQLVDDELTLELRNCACGSTLAREVKVVAK